MPKRAPSLSLAALALALPSAGFAQDYSDLPPLTPMSEAELQALPPEYRTAPRAAETITGETFTAPNGVETIVRTRRIDSPRPAPAPYHAAQGAYAPVVLDRQQWIEECRRRTAGQDRDDTGLIIGGMLGALAGGIVGHEIASAGDRALGTLLGVGGGGLIGGLIGSLFDDDEDEDRYDCEAALDTYLSQAASAATPRIASRTIPGPAPVAGSDHVYGYPYAPPPTVLVPVRREVPQQVVVRETERFETYTVPPAPRP